jgi:hypothetical protein
VVLRQLPRERATLLLRILGAGPVLAEAIADLKALPDDAWERRIALPLLVALRLEIQQDPVDESEREFLMTTAELYEYWKDQHKREGAEEALHDALRAAYEARFGPMPEDVAAAVETTHDSATLRRWVQIIATRTPEDIASAVGGSAAKG